MISKSLSLQHVHIFFKEMLSLSEQLQQRSSFSQSSASLIPDRFPFR